MVTMNNFEFHNPTKLIFGKDQIAKVKENIDVKSKVLLTYGGGSIKTNGVYDQVRQALADHTVFEFGGIESNPKYETLMQAVELVKSEKIDFVLAVGGGSVIDGSKFICAASLYEGDDAWDLLAKRAPFTSALPLGTVLTLPATGSEMNMFAVVSRGEDKLGFGHPAMYPKFSILDPTVTYTLSERQLGNGVVDAFVHVTEQYLTDNINTPVQDRFAEGLLQTLIEEGEKVIHVKEDYDSRANLMFSATMALNGLIGCGVTHDWATHMMGHELTALYGIDHARTLAVILPSLLRVQKENKKEKLLQFATRVWKLEGGTPESRIDQAINLTEDFFNRMGLPTKLKVYKIEKDQFGKIIESVQKHIPVNLGEKQDIDADKMMQILEGAY
jgi:NADP-dependent alcohol dehydrogenase